MNYITFGFKKIFTFSWRELKNCDTFILKINITSSYIFIKLFDVFYISTKNKLILESYIKGGKSHITYILSYKL